MRHKKGQCFYAKKFKRGPSKITGLWVNQNENAANLYQPIVTPYVEVFNSEDKKIEKLAVKRHILPFKRRKELRKLEEEVLIHNEHIDEITLEQKRRMAFFL